MVRVIKIKDLVKKAKHGDKEAFISLFQLHKDQLYRMAYIYTRNIDDALDVIQETAYQAYKKISTLKNEKYFKTWIIRITINCSINLVRKQETALNMEPAYIEKSVYKDDDVPLYIIIEELLSYLNYSEKSVIVLKFYFGYSYKEIAEMLDLPIGTIKSRYYRSLDKLRNSVERGDYYEE